MKENIPLSWSHKEIESPCFHSITLPLSGLPWVHTVEIPFGYSTKELCSELSSEFPDGFLLRGCGDELAGHLGNNGCELIRTGAQGVVDLEKLSSLPQTVIDLVRRGGKQGSVKELHLTANNMQRVSQFFARTSYGSKPRLQYLFKDAFDSYSKCFVLSTANNKWLGVLSVSFMGKSFAHTEMILRDKEAPVGVMEALFVSVMNILRQEGVKHFSLGEVPFVSPEGIEEASRGVTLKQSILEAFFFNAGHLLRFAYNYKGLFDFKNKFDPEWKPVYICATPKLSFLSLIDLFYETGYFDLSRSELIANIKHYFPIPTSSG